MRKFIRAKQEPTMEERMLLEMAAEVLTNLMHDAPVTPAEQTKTIATNNKRTKTPKNIPKHSPSKQQQQQHPQQPQQPQQEAEEEEEELIAGKLVRVTAFNQEREKDRNALPILDWDARKQSGRNLSLPPLITPFYTASPLNPTTPAPVLPSSSFSSSSSFLLSSASSSSSSPSSAAIPPLTPLRSSTSAFTSINNLPGMSSFNAKASLNASASTPSSSSTLPPFPLPQQQQQTQPQPMQLLFHHIHPTAKQQQHQHSQTQRHQQQQQRFNSGNTTLGQTPKRRRRKTSATECAVLKAAFDAGMYHPPLQLRKELAVAVGMTERQIQVWFQNRRQKLKKGLLPTPLPSPSNLCPFPASPQRAM